MGAAFETTGRWMGDERPLMGWLTTPRDRIGAHGVVLLPPLGYEYWSSHRTLRALAERLATQGHTVLRLDHDGTADSSGDRWDPDRVAAWRSAVRLAVEELRAFGMAHVAIVGARLGATLADAVVAWVPVLHGKRYGKELRMLALPVPEEHTHTRMARRARSSTRAPSSPPRRWRSSARSTWRSSTRRHRVRSSSPSRIDRATSSPCACARSAVTPRSRS